MREGKAGQQQKRPSLRKSTPWCPSKRGRKAPPTGCGGETAPSWGRWADCPPKAFPILSTDWVKSPHAGTWTGPHREERPLRGLSSPHLTCRPPPPPPHQSTYPRPRGGGEKAGVRTLEAASTSWPRLLDHALEERTDRSHVAGPPRPRAH